MSATTTEVILHCQRQIKKEPSEDKLLHYIGKLSRLPIQMQDLIATGIGRTVNQLSRHEGKVGEQAYNLVTQWKAIVEAEKSATSSSESEEDEEEESPSSPHTNNSYKSELRDSNENLTEYKPHAHVINSLESNGDSYKRPKSNSSSNSSSHDSESEHSEKQDSDPPQSPEPLTTIKTEPCEKFLPSSSSEGEQDSSHSNSSSSEEEEEEEEKSSSLSHPPSSSSSQLKIKSEPHSPSPQPKAKSHSSKQGISVKNTKSSSEEEEEEEEEDLPDLQLEKKHLVKVKERNYSNSESRSPTKESASKVKSEKSERKEIGSSRDVGMKHSKLDSNIKLEKSDKDKIDKTEKEEKKPEKSSKHHHHHERERESHSSSRHKNGYVDSDKSSSYSKIDKKDERKKRKIDEVETSSSPIKKEKKIKLEQSPSKQSVADYLKPKLLPRLNVEIDSTSGINFSDVLSGLDSKNLKRAKSKKHKVESKSDKNSSKDLKLDEKEAKTSVKIEKIESYEPSSSSSSKRISHHNKEHHHHHDKHKTSSSSSHHHHHEKSKSSSKSKTHSKDAEKSELKTNTKERSRDGGDKHKKKEEQERVRVVAKVLPYVHQSHESPNNSGGDVSEDEILRGLADSNEKFWEDSRLSTSTAPKSSFQTESEALASMTSSRNQRTKVYSGVKSGVVGKVPTLFKMCIRVIQENIDDLGYTGGVPYEILEPVLSRATVDQLLQIEDYNEYLIENTDDLWKFHCSKKFKGRVPDELESWRELYFRLIQEQSAKFDSLTRHLKTKIEVATPVRKAKLAYVETSSGPKFSKSKAATIKSGMSSLKTREEKGGQRGHGSSASSGGNNSQNKVVVEEASVIIKGKGRGGGGGGGGGGHSGGGNSSQPRSSEPTTSLSKKPRKAPLMQKTLKSMKTLMRR